MGLLAEDGLPLTLLPCGEGGEGGGRVAGWRQRWLARGDGQWALAAAPTLCLHVGPRKAPKTPYPMLAQLRRCAVALTLTLTLIRTPAPAPSPHPHTHTRPNPDRCAGAGGPAATFGLRGGGEGRVQLHTRAHAPALARALAALTPNQVPA